ncbi:MAG: xylulokinase [Acidimicrobiales bacterium]
MTRPSRDEQLVLAVDLGTGGPKVGFVSLTGRVSWQDHFGVVTQRLPKGGAEQDAEAWWTIITGAVRKVLASGAVHAEAIVAVACTGQWDSTVPVDADGVPVGPCILWQDYRGARHVHEMVGGRVAGYAPAKALRWIRKTGGVPGSSDALAHMLYLDRDRPDVARAARWYLEPVDYLTMRFTGVASASHASMTAAWLTDNRHLDVLEYDAALVAMAGVDASKLPPLRATGSIVGPVRDDVATELGLPAGVQVVAGLTDLHAAAIGCGALGEYEAHMALSTTSWISAPVPFKRTDVFNQIACVPGLTPELYLIANSHDTGGVCLEWLRDNVLTESDQQPCPYDELTAIAGSSTPGSGGILFTPWLKGERSPVDDRHARAGFHNLSLTTGRADMVRAVLEGVAFNNRWLHEAVEKFVKRRLDPIRMVGGGAASELWCQIHADAMDRTIERVAEPLHAQLRGVGIAAGLALGAVTAGEVRDLVTVEATFTPDPANRVAYERLYAEFPKLYKAQKAMFARLNRSPIGARQ